MAPANSTIQVIGLLNNISSISCSLTIFLISLPSNITKNYGKSSPSCPPSSKPEIPANADPIIKKINANTSLSLKS